MSPAGRVRGQGVEAEVFAAPEAVCLVPSDHPLATEKTLAPQDLADTRFVSLASEDAARGRIDRLFEQAGVRRRIVVETQYSVTICNLVRNGVGVSLVNPLALEGLDRTGLTIVPFTPRVHFRTLLITPPSGTLSQVAGAFLAEAKRQLALG